MRLLPITPPLPLGLIVALAALALAACGGDSNGGDGSAAARSANGAGGLVSMSSVDGTDVLVNSAGPTLYTANVEHGGRIRCTGECTSFWQPLETTAKQAKSAASRLNLGLDAVKRPDGTSQLTLDGVPLYTFTQEGARSLSGNGFTDDFNGRHFEWSAAGTGGATGADRSGDSGSPQGGSYPY